MAGRSDSISRGAFLKRASGLLGIVVFGPPVTRPHVACEPEPLDHPDPRPGITGEKVLTVDALPAKRADKFLPSYDAAREYPGVFDGIACGCGCGGKHGAHRSLLVCFETLQPTGCGACQQEAQLVARLAKDEKTLAEIRAAVDKKFG